MKTRDKEIDYIKSFALFLVLLVHLLGYSGLVYSNVDSYRYVGIFALYFVARMCCPLFFISTGWLRNDKQRIGNLKKHYINSLKIIVPYIFASLVCGMIRILIGEITVSEMLIGILLFKTAPYSWYVKYFLVLYMIIPFVDWIYLNLRNKLLIIIAMTIAVGFATYYRYQTGSAVLRIIMNLFPILYYLYGKYINDNIDYFKKNRKTFICIFIIITILQAIIRCLHYWGSELYIVPNGYGEFALTIASFCMFLNLYFWVSSFEENGLVEAISNSTLCAYLISYIGDVFIKWQISQMGIFPANWWECIFMLIQGFLIASIMGVVLTILSKKMIKVLHI